LSSLIIKLKNNVFAEVFQRNFRATPGTETPHFVGPVLESRIVRDTALQRDRCKFGVPWRLTAGAGIASFAMLNNFCRASQSAYFADACNVTAIPLNAEFKVFVGIKTRRIDGKFQPYFGISIWTNESSVIQNRAARVNLRRFYPSGETELASRAYQSTLHVTYITIASTMKSAIAPISNA
jgi:hypothetical protein